MYQFQALRRWETNVRGRCASLQDDLLMHISYPAFATSPLNTYCKIPPFA